MDYNDMTMEQRSQNREYMEAAQTRFSAYRDSKETMAFAGLAVFLGACATALSSGDWPPKYASQKPLLILGAFTVFWILVAIYLRYQLRERRWAAFRVAGCDWLLAEWLPDSPFAMKQAPRNPERRPKPDWRILALDLVCPQERAVVAIDPDLRVYPHEIERTWLLAATRPADALRLERIIHVAGWIGYLVVIARTLLVRA